MLDMNVWDDEQWDPDNEDHRREENYYQLISINSWKAYKWKGFANSSSWIQTFQ